MPRNSVGVYSLPVAPFVSASVIISGDVNSDLSDIGIALTQSLATTGVSIMTGPVKLASGTVTAPGLTFNANNGVGFYLAAANSLGIAVNSVSIGLFNASATAIWGFDHIFGSVVSLASVVGLSGGFRTTVTVTGMLDITGGLIIGYDGTPDIDTIKIGTSTLGFDFDAGTEPRLKFDINSDILYNRGSNYYQFTVSSSVAKQLSATNLFYSGELDFTEVTAPASAATDQAIIYAKDNGSGLSRMYYKDDQGVETPMGGIGYWELIDTITVTTSITSWQINLSKSYSRLVMVGVSVSPASSFSENAFVVQSSSDFFANQPDADGSLVGTRHGADTDDQSLVCAVMTLPSGGWTAQRPLSFTVEYINCNNTGYKNVTGYSDNPGETTVQALAGVNSSAGYAPINSMRGIFFFGDIYSGRMFLYGQIAA